MRLRRWIACFAVLFTVACGKAPETDSALQANPLGWERFPSAPHETVTPGLLCLNPDEYRYPEGIAYCQRRVSTSLKAQIIQLYDETFEYRIGSMKRDDFKIDHYIPLCMGGDNRAENLWPQHKTVYTKTDRLEEKLCQLLNQATVTQIEAVEWIKYAKQNNEEATEIERAVDQFLVR
jgi:hypothetical protein